MSGTHIVFAKMANLHDYLIELQRKHSVLKIALFGSVSLNVALIALVLLLASAS